ncbi:hypothetical protein AS189_01650 [Arthrobacter alpinus]|uniref:WXG100 family type VII secretion target n=2 Tax=Arthrobacter alpinus TaxID=656366 RepID=A0A0S2LWA7_9MICC|nr:hypothetical protein AS189_01650 [Arthrobacter alpinus]
MLGADPDQLRTFAKDFSRAAQTLLHASNSLSQQINRPGCWQGGDADRFRSQWNSKHRPTLAAASREFDQVAAALLRNAEEQETASSVSSLTAGSTGPGSPGNPGPGSPDEETNAWDQVLIVKDLMERYLLGGDAMTIFGNSSKIAEALIFFRNGGSFAGLSQGMQWAKAGSFFQGLNTVLEGESVGAWIQKFGNKIDDLPGGISNWGSKINSLADPLGNLAKGAGKVLGPLGLGLGVVSAIDNFADEDYVGGTLDVVATGLGTAALFTPPPVNLAFGAAAGAVAIGGLVYENWDAISEWGGDVASNVQDFGEDVGRNMVEAGGNLIEGAGDFANGVAETAKNLWPF